MGAESFHEYCGTMIHQQIEDEFFGGPRHVMIVHYTLMDGHKGIGLAYDTNLELVTYYSLIDRSVHGEVAVASVKVLAGYNPENRVLCQLNKVHKRDLMNLYGCYSWQTGREKQVR